MTVANMGATAVPRLRGFAGLAGFWAPACGGAPPRRGARGARRGGGKPAKPRQPAKNTPSARDYARAGNVTPARSAGFFPKPPGKDRAKNLAVFRGGAGGSGKNRTLLLDSGVLSSIMVREAHLSVESH